MSYGSQKVHLIYENHPWKFPIYRMHKVENRIWVCKKTSSPEVAESHSAPGLENEFYDTKWKVNKLTYMGTPHPVPTIWVQRCQQTSHLPPMGIREVHTVSEYSCLICIPAEWGVCCHLLQHMVDRDTGNWGSVSFIGRSGKQKYIRSAFCYGYFRIFPTWV